MGRTETNHREAKRGMGRHHAPCEGGAAPADDNGGG